MGNLLVTGTQAAHTCRALMGEAEGVGSWKLMLWSCWVTGGSSSACPRSHHPLSLSDDAVTFSGKVLYL